MTAKHTPTVTREDAIRFCNTAMRNWQYVSFDEDELEDLRAELQRHREATEATHKAREAELVEALERLLNFALGAQAQIDPDWDGSFFEDSDFGVARNLINQHKGDDA